MAADRSEPKRRSSSGSGLQRSVIWISVAIILALPILQTVNQWSQHRQTMRATEVKASELAHILAEHMRRVMGEVDASLKQLVLHSARVGGPSASSDSWLPVLSSARAGMSHLRSLNILDTKGTIRHSTLPVLIGQSRDNEYIFKRLATDGQAGIIADTPFRSLVDQRVLIPLGRRLEGPGGSFDGAVVATLTPEAFRDFYESVDVGREGIIWVVHPTGLVLCSEPQIHGPNGGFLSVPQPLLEAVNREEPGILRAALQADGATYVSAWRSLHGIPVTIAVSFNLPEALGSWRRNMILSIGWSLLLSLVLGAASFQLARQLAARAAAEDTLIQRDQELVEAQRIAGLGSARITFPEMRVRLTPNLAAMLELSNGGDEFTLETLIQCMIESDRTRLREAIDSCRAYGIRYEIELNARLADGAERILHSEGVLADDGKSILAIFGDVTERRLAHQRTSHNERMAALGRLTGGVAHDFNNILTAIIGYGELLLRRMDEREPKRRDIEEIVKAGGRAAELTKQLLAFSRKQVLQPKVIDLNRVVADIQAMLARLIGENIELRTNLNPGLGYVKVDPGQIEQVIINLAVNARDAMPKGGKLTIETTNVEVDESYAQTDPSVETGAYVMLAVSDTGHGIDRDLVPHIFEPFFTTKERGKGTGLGLATVYGIVKQSGGNVWVYSEPGKGTTFKVYIPRVDEAVELDDARAPAVESLRGTETILLVEDQEVVRRLVRKILETRGYTVLEACDAQDALSLFHQYEGRIQLIITDVVMPGMSGRDLAQRLEELGNEIRVLYMSGYTDDTIVRHGVLDPAIPFLQKPFTPDVLSRKVREVLDAR
jgi:signal transduction histidine kinase